MTVTARLPQIQSVTGDMHRRDFARAALAIWDNYGLTADRSELTARDLLGRARLLISHLGHAPVEQMSDPRGVSLRGAIYLAAGYYAGHTDLDMPQLCPSHTGRRSRFPRPCLPECEARLWRECNHAIAYLVEAGRTAEDLPLHLGRVRVRPHADLCDLGDLDRRLDAIGALAVLRRALQALPAPAAAPVVRPRASAYALVGVAA